MSLDTAQLTIDRDGFSIEEDCHDSNANIHPQAVEYWNRIGEDESVDAYAWSAEYMASDDSMWPARCGRK